MARSWTVARHRSFPALIPLPDQYLKSTTPFYRVTVAFERSSPGSSGTSPPPPSTRYQIRNPTRDNPSLTSGSEIFPPRPFSRLFWPHRRVWIETFRAIIPGLRCKKRKRLSPFSPSSIHTGMYHAIFLLAIQWTLTLQCTLVLSNLFSLHLSQKFSQKRLEIYCYARGSGSCFVMYIVLSRMSHHMSRRIKKSNVYRSYYVIIR